jgi:hypothetical protein
MSNVNRFASAALATFVAAAFATIPAGAITFHQVYVLNAGNRSVTIYADRRFGDVAPVRRIVGNSTRISNPIGMAVDTVGQIYVLNRRPAEVLIFATGAHGDVTPVGVIAGVRTLLRSPRAIALNYRDEVIVADAATGIQIFGSRAVGNTSPIRSLPHSAGIPPDINGVGVDLLGDIYFTSASSDWVTNVYSIQTDQSLLTHRLGGAHTLIHQPTAMSVDRFGRIYVSNRNNSSLIFAAGAREDTAPYVVIRGPKTALNGPGVSGFDSAACVFTPNARANSVTEYDPDTTGNTLPTDEFSGPRTQLSGPVAVVYL